MDVLVAGVNWLAVGVSTILCFGLGALWYSKKLFGTKWAEGVGIEIGADVKQPVPALAMQLLGTFLLAWIISLAIANVAIPIGILFASTSACLLMAGSMFGQNSRYATIAEGSFVMVMAVIMIIVQSLF